MQDCLPGPGRGDPLSFKLDAWIRFEGDAEALADAATRILDLMQVKDEAAPFTARLVRDYAQRGIVARPSRFGKETRYGFQHIVEFIAARALVRDGWPLAKIAEYIAKAQPDELLGLIAPSAETPAQQAVRAIRRRSDVSGPDAAGLASSGPGVTPGPRSGGADPHTAARSAQAWLAGRKAELPALLSAIGGSATPDIAQTVEITLAPDIRLVISAHRLSRLTAADAEAIGRAVIASLVGAGQKGSR